MRLNKLLVAVAASALVSAPVMANPATPLSLSNAASVKAKTSVTKGSRIDGAAYAIGGLALVAVIGGILLASDDDDDDDSDSN